MSSQTQHTAPKGADFVHHAPNGADVVHHAPHQGGRNLLSHRQREFQLLDEPLEHYFRLIGQRPCKGEISAEWEIEDGWLYLTRLTTLEAQDPPLTLDRLFPFAGRRVFAAWYSGEL